MFRRNPLYHVLSAPAGLQILHSRPPHFFYGILARDVLRSETEEPIQHVMSNSDALGPLTSAVHSGYLSPDVVDPEQPLPHSTGKGCFLATKAGSILQSETRKWTEHTSKKYSDPAAKV